MSKSYNQRNAKTDKNQAYIVDGLRQIGCYVLVLSTVKNAFDILVGYRDKFYAIEIKNDEYVPKRLPRDEALLSMLTKGEMKCKHDMEAAGCNYSIAANFEECLDIIGVNTGEQHDN